MKLDQSVEIYFHAIFNHLLMMIISLDNLTLVFTAIYFVLRSKYS